MNGRTQVRANEGQEIRVQVTGEGNGLEVVELMHARAPHCSAVATAKKRQKERGGETFAAQANPDATGR